MAITFSCPRSLTILSIWGENMHLGASPRALRIVELLGQEKDICFQSSIYYAKWTKLRIHCKNGKLYQHPNNFFQYKILEKLLCTFPGML